MSLVPLVQVRLLRPEVQAEQQEVQKKGGSLQEAQAGKLHCGGMVQQKEKVQMLCKGVCCLKLDKYPFI